MLLVIKNAFHGAEAAVLVNKSTMTVSRAAIERASKKLCGMSDCSCHHNSYSIYGDGVDLIDMSDGSERIKVQL